MKNQHVVAVIQARMGSTRLPAKSLLLLHDNPIIDWVVQRVKQSTLLDGFVVAIPDTRENDPLALHLAKQNVKVYRGSENDVLDRMVQAAAAENATHVVRVCADNPLICGEEIDTLIRWYFDNSFDYVYNHIPLGNLYPDGLGAEIVSMKIFTEIAAKATHKDHREHCLSYIRFASPQYSIGTFDPLDEKIQRPDLKLDIDTFHDYCQLAVAPIHIGMAPQEIVDVFKRLEERVSP